MADVKEALAVLRRAVENERLGYTFYQDVVARVAAPKGKEMLASLGKDETCHLRLLLVEYRSLEKGEEWVDPEQAMKQEIKVDMSQPLFQGEEMAPVAFPWQEAAGRRWSRLETDLAVLKFGMEMEEKFYKMYRAAFEGSVPSSPAGRAYQFLMVQENGHFRLLQEAYNYLDKNGVWWDDWQKPMFEGG